MNTSENARQRLTRLVLAFANSTKGLSKKKKIPKGN